MSLTLGEKMRQAREERGISISEVAEQTRISPQYLRSIEDDDYKPLPGGIFNKGFLKSYARYIGYDEHEALQEYSKMIAVAETSNDEEFRSYKPEVLTDDNAAASPLPTIIFAGVILTLMTLGILYVVRYMINQPDAPAVTNVNSAPTNTNVVNEPALQPTNDTVPTMESLKVIFRTADNPISLSSISDGKSAVSTITADKPAEFEPRESLRLAYSRSLAASAQFVINGRTIALPQAPANPKRAAIEIELNRANLTQVWQNSKIEPLGPAAPAPATNSATRSVARPATPAANAAANRPANTSGATSAPGPRTSPR